MDRKLGVGLEVSCRQEVEGGAGSEGGYGQEVREDRQEVREEWQRRLCSKKASRVSN